MEYLQSLAAWLEQVSGYKWLVDCLDTTTGSAGVFPLGVRQVARKTNILGGEYRRLEHSFKLKLRLSAPAHADGRLNAAVLRMLEEAVRREQPPAVGEYQTAVLENARLERSDGETAVYAATLRLEADGEL